MMKTFAIPISFRAVVTDTAMVTANSKEHAKELVASHLHNLESLRIGEPVQIEKPDDPPVQDPMTLPKSSSIH